MIGLHKVVKDADVKTTPSPGKMGKKKEASHGEGTKKKHEKKEVATASHGEGTKKKHEKKELATASHSEGAKKKHEKKEPAPVSHGEVVSRTIFIGQLPYKCTGEQIKEHFRKGGAGEVTLRLLTDKKTKRFRGIAFGEVRDEKSMRFALRLHHSIFLGRCINVERSCGGGGKGEKRKAHLKEMRDSQSTLLRRNIDTMLAEAVEASDGCILRTDFDDRIVDVLCTFPTSMVREALDEFANCENLESMK